MIKEDLTGQIFGTIEIISEAPNIKGRTVWHCKCIKCGTEKDIITSFIKDGRTRSCGCGCIIDKNNQTISSSTRICSICGKTFTLKNNAHTRKYCYDCSPSQTTKSKRVITYRQSVKKALVEYKGGKCEKCGYNKCIGAL